MMRPVSVHVTSTAPAASTATGGRDAGDPTKVTLSWNDTTPVDYEDPTTWGDRSAEIGYRIERATITWRGHTAFETVGTAVANATTYTDTTAEADGVYLYRVTSWNEGGSSPSNQIAVLGGTAAATSVTVSSDVEPSVLGDPVTFTATVSTTLATGSVVFEVDGVAQPAQPVVDGAATFTTTSLPIGSHQVVAVYGGDTHFASSTSDPLTQTVLGWPTTLTLQSSRNPSFDGQSVTFTAIVQDALQEHGTPTGSVRFTITDPSGNVTTTEVALASNGAATLTTAALAIGDHTVAAEYLPTGTFAGSVDQLTQRVTLRPTSTVVISSRYPSTFGQQVIFTATVRTTGGATGTPTGPVQFSISNAVGLPTVATVNLSNTGVATFSSSTLSPGDHTVTVTYAANGVFGASSGSLLQSVIGRPTVTTLTSNRNPSSFGQSVSLTAAVRTTTANNGTPTGAVQFTITNPVGAATVVTVNVDRNGNAVYTSTLLSTGTHRVSTVYVPSGTQGFEPSTAALSQIVNRGTATVTVSASNTRPRRGQSVTLTAQVSPVGATGTVRFTVNGVAFGAAVPVAANGRATLTTTTLPVGTLAIRATYSGDRNLFGATSNPLTVTVR